MRFDELSLNPAFLEKLQELGFEGPTLIQEKCIPEIAAGKDVVGQAETGSGKTLAFALPMLDGVVPGKGVQALILTPTRELCVQITEVFQDFGRPLGVKTASVYGGVSIDAQIKNIRTADVIVGTPGRILDHMRRKTIHFGNVKFLVLDETDRMLDMGFIDDVRRIIESTPRGRQTLMFSATIYENVQRIMQRYLRDPLIIMTQEYVDESKLGQVYYDIQQQNHKFSLLVHLLKNNTSGMAIVFCATREESDIVAKNLQNHGINASAIHGGMSQHQRQKSLNMLKNQQADVLVATDVAARGLDIKNVSHIYNYDVPKTAKDYIHRIGRTARAGENGSAVTLLTERDHDSFRRVQREYDITIKRAELPKFKKVTFVRNADGRRRPVRKYRPSGQRRHARR